MSVEQQPCRRLAQFLRQGPTMPSRNRSFSMSESRKKGSRQKAFRQRQKEKQQASERQLQQLSERVTALQLERDQLQRALGSATNEGPQGSGAGSEAREEAEGDQVVATFLFGEATPKLLLTQREARALSIDAMAKIWKTLVHKMAWCLDQMAFTPMDSQHIVQSLVHDAMVLMWALVEHNLRSLNSLVTINIETPTAPQSSSIDPRDWPAILGAMQLHDGQAEQLLATRRTLLHELGILFAERDRLWVLLQNIEDVEESTEGAMTRFAEAAGLTERLRANVNALHTCRSFHISYIYTRVLSPVQMARYLVACLPMGPDALSLLTCLAIQSDEPSTEELLRAARPGTAAMSAASSGSGASSGAGASSGSSSNTSLPPCLAGNWRQALEQPLRLLHAFPHRTAPASRSGATAHPSLSGHFSWPM